MTLLSHLVASFSSSCSLGYIVYFTKHHRHVIIFTGTYYLTVGSTQRVSMHDLKEALHSQHFIWRPCTTLRSALFKHVMLLLVSCELCHALNNSALPCANLLSLSLSLSYIQRTASTHTSELAISSWVFLMSSASERTVTCSAFLLYNWLMNRYGTYLVVCSDWLIKSL